MFYLRFLRASLLRRYPWSLGLSTRRRGCARGARMGALIQLLVAAHQLIGECVDLILRRGSHYKASERKERDKEGARERESSKKKKTERERDTKEDQDKGGKKRERKKWKRNSCSDSISARTVNPTILSEWHLYTKHEKSCFGLCSMRLFSICVASACFGLEELTTVRSAGSNTVFCKLGATEHFL